MITKATLRYIRISPRKVRPVVALIKGKKAEEAIGLLYTIKKRASAYLIDLLGSAVSNAKRIPNIDAANLYISKLVVNGGPQMKRFRAASMGRASAIRKRTSHITLELNDLAQGAAAKEKLADKDAHTVKSAVKHAAASHDGAMKRKGVKSKGPVKKDTGKKGK